ncbi:MAG: universal stress protein [Methanotrichaceae archaeon]|nr:universal stress protein [Methanotrichaceae archaeon]
MFEKILIATDGSEHSERAAKFGIELAKLSGGKLIAMYIADISRMAHLPDDMLLFSIRELLIKEGNEAVEFVEKLAAEAAVPCEKVVIEGIPGDEILSYASKANINIIVMGNVGRTGLDKFLLGSVAEKIVRNSKIPILTIPRESA